MTQNSDEVVDITNWRVDEEYRRYPEGARTKALSFSPAKPPYKFLKPNFPYLFKLSSHRYPEQFWMEIFAYQFGEIIDVPVPRAFVAVNRQNNQCGALIEWFLEQNSEDFEPGGDFFMDLVPGFDRKKGTQHNFETLSEIFHGLGARYQNLHNWLSYWAKVFAFDMLIGNTDRHQDNWGIVTNGDQSEARIAPAFDNGTSLGHEIRAEKFVLANDAQWLKTYVDKGRHHIRWKISDLKPMNHLLLLTELMATYPSIKQTIINCIDRVDFDKVNTILKRLCSFDVPVKLTKERAEFLLTLLRYRYNTIKPILEK